MSKTLGLIVTDASPLITLAAGEALECLTMPELPVIIPDMVYFEVTQDLVKTGANDIVQWTRKHSGQVRIAATNVFSEFQALCAVNPRTRSKGRGEQAALEILNSEIANDPDLQAALLFEDSDILRRKFVRALPEGVMTLSTGDLLFELEAAGFIPSMENILDLVAGKGRIVDAQRKPSTDEESRMALHTHLQE